MDVLKSQPVVFVHFSEAMSIRMPVSVKTPAAYVSPLQISHQQTVGEVKLEENNNSKTDNCANEDDF